MNLLQPVVIKIMTKNYNMIPEIHKFRLYSIKKNSVWYIYYGFSIKRFFAWGGKPFFATFFVMAGYEPRTLIPDNDCISIGVLSKTVIGGVGHQGSKPYSNKMSLL